MFDSELKKFGRSFFVFFFSVITLILTYLSLFLNAYTSVDEKTTIELDNPFTILLWFTVVLIAICVIRKYYKTQDTYYFNRIFLIVSLILLIVGTYIIFTRNIAPVADQQDILNSANALINGDYSYFLPTGYVGKCTNQAGIVMILYYLVRIFGENSYRVFQVINIFGLIGSYYCICEISQLSFHSDELKNWTLLFLVLFLPLTWYVVFVYGNMLGMFFSLFAILSGYNYFEYGKIRYIFYALFGITLAMMFKSNYLIIFVAMLLFVILDVILNKRYQSILLVILLVPTYFASSWIPNTMIQSITGIQLGKGIPMTAYVEMGLQDTPDSPGWFNSYNWNVYTNNGSDSEKAGAQVKEDLKNTLVYWLSHPGEFINFLYRKTVSQWCNPDFQGTWLLRHSDFYIHGDGYYQFYNIFQSIICLGTLAYIYFTGRKMKLHRLLLPTVFIGGFIFHLFWEAKGQYTITYFVLLIPYCAKGFIDMTNEMSDGYLRFTVAKGIPKKMEILWQMDTVKYILLLFASTFIIYLIM